MVKKISELEYKRADIDAAVAYMDTAISRIKAAASAAEINAVRLEVNEYMKSVGTDMNIASWRHTLDVKDEFYANENDYYDEHMPWLAAKSAEYTRAMLDSPHASDLESVMNPIIVRNIRADVRTMDDRILDERIEENKLVTEYDELLTGVMYKWGGKKLTLGKMQALCKSPDREVRKKAFTVIGTTLLGVRDRLDGIFDRLVKVRTAMAKKLGFENFVEMGDLRIGHVGYGRKEIEVFRNSVLKDVVPVLSELKTKLAAKLGIDGIRIYDNDIYIAGGNIDPAGDAKDLFAAAQRMYDDMSPELGAFFKQMCDAQAIDYESRENKMYGGYAEMLFDYAQPVIFANFNGTMDDVGVLTHEFGHAYAFKRVVDNDIDYSLFVGGMETAETHSMSMEALCNKYNGLFYGERAAEATFQQIFDALNFLPYGVTVDYFQQLVYENPDMTPAERRKLWMKLESEFRPYVDMSDVPYFNEGGRWQYQKHIFESPFYYIDYCLSTCLALQFGERSVVDFRDALARYLALVDKGGSQDITELAHGAGLKSPFDRGALGGVCGSVKARLEKLGEEIG